MSQQPKSTLLYLECSICGAQHDDRVPQTICTVCGRVLLARYDLEAAQQTFSRESLGGRSATIWRYWEVMPIRACDSVVSLGEGMTPLLFTERLGSELGMKQLFVKDEGVNPTGSFKARGLSAAASKAVELGIPKIALPTAGNAGGAAAAYGARGGLGVHVSMPMDAPQAMMNEVQSYGGELDLFDGLISDCGKRVAALCRDSDWFDIATLKEPYRAEGKKTMGFELWEQLDGELPDVLLYPLGGGTGVVGMWKAFDELEGMGLIDSRRPRMIVVQATGCAPIVRAFEAGEERAEPWQDAATLAPGIRVPTPFADDIVLDVLRQSHGDAIAVDEAEILDGMREIAAREGINACPEGGALLAGLRHLLASGRVDRSERTILFNTGSGLKHPELQTV
ncbi:MAG: threonine synthase [Acidobacteriota bacterium]